MLQRPHSVTAFVTVQCREVCERSALMTHQSTSFFKALKINKIHFCLSHTQQFVECVSCSGAIGLRGQQRVKDDFTKPLQAEGDPAGKETWFFWFVCF